MDQRALTTDIATTSTHVSKQECLISDSAKYYIEIYVHIISFILMAVLGIMANVVNMTVYFKFGLKDSITVGFFALSISDLAVAGTPLFAAFCYATTKIAPDTPVDPVSLHYVSAAWLRSMFYSVSCTITTYLSVERCCCVVFPLKVKFIFTRKRTIVVICLVYFAHVLIYAPVFATHQLQWKTNPATNVTRVGVIFLPHRKEIEDFNQTVANIILPIVTQVIVTISAIAMVNGLKKASKFRNKVTNKEISNKTTAFKTDKAKKGSGNINKHTLNMDGKDDDKDIPSRKRDTGLEETANAQSGLSAKDARLVQTMIILVILLTISNIPFLMLIYARRVIPGLAIGGAYKNLWSTSYSVIYLLGAANASANVIVYYKISARFRHTVLETFCCAVGHSGVEERQD